MRFLFFLIPFFTFNIVYGQKENINEQIGFYQKYISDLRNGDCPMYPSCSDYGVKMLNENKNTLYAMSLISERLLRCGHESKMYNTMYDPHKEMFKLLDTSSVVQKNDLKLLERNFLDKIEVLDSLFLFTKDLINKENYDGALLELERIKFFNKRYDKEVYNKHLLYCFYQKNRYEDYIYYYEKNGVKGDEDLVRLLGNSYYRLGNYNKALEKYGAYTDFKEGYASDKLKFNKGFVLAHGKKYSEALQEISKINSFNVPKKEALSVISNMQGLKYKKPVLGAILNIVPGLGYLYAGHKATATSSFVINGLLAYATYTSINTKNYGIAVLTGIFNVSFYMGNIFGGVKSSKRYNQALFDKELSKVNIY